MIISLKEIRNFIICIAIPLLVGYLSTLCVNIISGSDIASVYHELTKPSFAPPSYIFPIVWSILYILIGISSYLIINSCCNISKIRDAMFYYCLQLVLNFVWTILFFGFGLKFTALICLIILIIVVIVMIIKFSKINKFAGYLNLIYLIWLVYAGFLNYFIWYLR